MEERVPYWVKTGEFEHKFTNQDGEAWYIKENIVAKTVQVTSNSPRAGFKVQEFKANKVVLPWNLTDEEKRLMQEILKLVDNKFNGR